ncbi:uncharacterized protein EKO05_0008010 [Ascochyta rabiei]|uniref:uncharacterized protein n=1 Tax=Didymella rabiei TaxID=5454 RepID=UPI0019027CA7|nr:uncharacterized protein EKO05_0008010 [Ascochyta rabiei]UPX17669.1 hypothetical protein EKO05_0008010 [Ascochyta rabiei]
MSTKNVKIFNFCKAIWAVPVERTELAKGEKKRLAVVLRWGQEGAEKAIELRLNVLRHWPFLRPGMLVGTFATIAAIAATSSAHAQGGAHREGGAD